MTDNSLFKCTSFLSHLLFFILDKERSQMINNESTCTFIILVFHFHFRQRKESNELNTKHQNEYREYCRLKGFPVPPIAPPIPTSIVTRNLNSMLSPQLLTIPCSLSSQTTNSSGSRRKHTLSEGNVVSCKESEVQSYDNDESLNELKKDVELIDKESDKTGENIDKEDDKTDTNIKEETLLLQQLPKHFEGQSSLPQEVIKENKLSKAEDIDTDETSSVKSQGSRKSSTDLTHIVNTTQPKQQIPFSQPQPVMTNQQPMYSFPGMYQQFGFPPSMQVPNMPSIYPNTPFPNPGMWGYPPQDQQQQFQNMPSVQQPQPLSCNIQGQRGMPVPEQSFQLATVSHPPPTGTGFTTSASASSVLQLSNNLPPNASSN